MIKFSKLKTTLVLLCVLFGVNLSLAAQAVNFSVSPQDLAVGKETGIVLSVNTEEQEINALQLRLKFSPDDFLIKDINDGNSIINLWIDKPKFSNPLAGGQSKGEISFSGIIPGGFEGKDAELVKIVAISKKTGEASFEISEAKVLLNDGFGTEAKLTLNNFKFNVAEVGLPTEIGLHAKDTEPPELFAPQIASDHSVFGGKYFLVFASQDKGSGIDRYEILESKIHLTTSDVVRWVATESPYLLKDQWLRSYIYVKAVDKAGNVRVAEIPPRNPLAWYENYLIYAIITLIALIAFAVYIFWRKLCVKTR